MIDILYSSFGYIKTSGISVLALIEQQQGALIVLASTAFVGAAGAYFGAVGAQKAINRETSLRLRTEKIATANAAHSMALVIYNQALSIKKQYFLPTYEKWDAQRRAMVRDGELGKTLSKAIEVHMNTFPPIHFPVDVLLEQVSGKLSLNGRPIAALMEVIQATHSLNALAKIQAILSDEFSGKDANYVVPKYLALKTKSGVDSRYKDICCGSLSLVDDLIFFSDVLANDLVAYGIRQRKFAPRSQRKALPEVNKTGKLPIEYNYLISDREIHKKWLEKHVIIEPVKKKWFGWW